MKIGKNRRGVSTVIAVLLMIIITVAAAVIVWAFLSGYIGSRTAPATQNSVIQINALSKATPSTASVQLVTVGSNPVIVAVYVDGADQDFTGTNFSTASTQGTVILLTLTGTTLTPGQVVKVVCADSGAASLTVT